MHRNLSLLILLTCNLLLPGAETYVLGGRVVNQATGAPIAGAMVSLTCYSGNTIHFPPQRTPVAGTFRFSSLTTTSCNGSVEKPGFVRQALLGSNNRSEENMEIRLPPRSVVTGTVTDSEGRPLQGVVIRALSETTSDGRRVRRQVRRVTTNDLGQYRLWDISENSLYIQAASASAGTVLFNGPILPSIASYETFHAVYSDGASRLADAKPLSLPPGSEAQADFRLSLEPARRVSGIVRNLRTYETATFEFQMPGEDFVPVPASLNGVDGRFELRDVASGRYRLRVTQGKDEQQLTALADVTVGDRDVQGISLTAQPLIRVSVAYSIPAGPEHSRFHVYNCGLAFTGDEAYGVQEPRPSPGKGQDVPETWSILLAPGTYHVTTDCAAISQIRVGNSILNPGDPLVLSPGTTTAELTVDLNAEGGHVRLTYPSKLGPPILLVPQFPSFQRSPMLVPSRDTGENDDREPVRAITPGFYVAYPIRPGDPYREPAFLNTLTNGKAVEVRKGEVTVIAQEGIQ